MSLIAGSFWIVGAKPDEDSIRFTSHDPAQWDLITEPNRVKRNASGAALRSVFEAHLHGVITHRRLPPGNVGLGPATLSVIKPRSSASEGRCGTDRARVCGVCPSLRAQPQVEGSCWMAAERNGFG
jgi:hypothetical protein